VIRGMDSEDTGKVRFSFETVHENGTIVGQDGRRKAIRPLLRGRSGASEGS